jgi:uncharacterized membrane protein YczE
MRFGGNLVRRVPQLFLGLVLYGLSMAMMVDSGLGLTSWDVFHQGLSRVTGLSLGWIVILVGIPVLLLWIPLRLKPGFGTLANLVVVGLAVDWGLALLSPVEWFPGRILYLIGGIVLNGVATGLYIGSDFGAGPRDGLMTGVHARYPRLSLRLVRTGIELTVLVAGFFLGGTAGVGTLAYALAIGPLSQVFIPMFTVRRPASAVVAMDTAW